MVTFTCRRSKLLVVVLLCASLSFGIFNCGKKGPPKAPHRENPPQVIDLTHRIEGQQIELSWNIPPEENRHQDDLAGFKVYRSKVTFSEAECDECPLEFNLIGDVPILKNDEPTPMKFSDELEAGYRYVYLVRGYGENQTISEDSNLVEFVYD